MTRSSMTGALAAIDMQDLAGHETGLLEIEHGIAAGKFKFDGHWNADGHRWSADALFEHLQSQRLIGDAAGKK